MSETILEEAARITDRDRAEAYGDAREHAERFAAIAAAATGLHILPEHFPVLLISLKLARAGQAPECWHRDSYVDIAGYARVAEKIHEERGAE